MVFPSGGGGTYLGCVSLRIAKGDLVAAAAVLTKWAEQLHNCARLLEKVFM